MNRHLDPQDLEDFARLEGEPRRRAREHLAGCSRCRSGLAAADPSRIFLLLGRTPVPAAVLDEVSRGVAEGLAAAGPAPVGGFTVPRLRLVGALAASLLLAVLVGLPMLTTPPRAPATVGQARAVAEAAAPRAAIDLVERADRAQVVDLTVGGTQVVMIFDEGMEL